MSDTQTDSNSEQGKERGRLPDSPQRRTADRVAEMARSQGYKVERADLPATRPDAEFGWRHYVTVRSGDGWYQGQVNDRLTVFEFSGYDREHFDPITFRVLSRIAEAVRS